MPWRSRNKTLPRYVVREGSSGQARFTVVQKFLKLPEKSFAADYWLAFDTYTGEYPYYVRGPYSDFTAKTQVEDRVAVLNKDAGTTEPPAFIFDTLTGQVVYENLVFENCVDHAAALNQADQETRHLAAESRWQAVAFALVRAQLNRHPVGWKVRDTGFDIQVIAPDGEIIAACETYADAASIQALGEMAFSNPVNLVQSQERHNGSQSKN